METSITRRGDSFDIAPSNQQGQQQGQQDNSGQQVQRQQSGEDILIKAISNPKDLVDSFGLSDEQVTNVRALVTGGGAALLTKYLGSALSEPVAGALGGLLGGWVSTKLVKRRKRSRDAFSDVFNNLGL